MVQSDEIDLPTSLGYLLKEAATALRVAMEDALRPLELTVTAYSCLEILAQRPGSSNSDLARGAFVTRQSMNVLLQTLEREGLVTRPATAAEGRVLPVTLTDAGLRRREQASAVVKAVEDRMLAELSAAERAQAFDVLTRMTRALREG
ncbi:MarR family winged helix-turn-helix transcriptional regulator [Microbacterium aquilitoris]|uniref:MarR family transcriptional regulator n=1 Tax=Microbacterium aquilitoris TaxID=3067307 RepID=A0ABU3GFZ1_9MICO|nr:MULTISPECIES: MarR family transcriptional regulator [unclassified Microbacterium]MDT3329601.1 MarR family transcriptional regulator [Microbacterium sp. KSW-18]MDT3345433.1 MarR family transcriptional regulator [Microbacterium sp. KSW2-22]